MNTEQAIEVIKTEKKCVIYNTKGCDRKCEDCVLLLPDKEILDAYNFVLSALRAQQERENPKPCEYCDAMFKPTKDTKLGEIITSSKLWYTFDGDGSSYFKNMNFCPMCGRPLEPKEAQR